MKTNTSIGGQLKLNLTIGNAGNAMEIKHFSLSPISKDVPFIYNNDTDLLNYTHLENIRAFYARTQGYFYSAATKPEFESGYPYYSDVLVDNRETCYDCGVYRNEVTRAGKQFSYFCPIWMESPEDFRDLRFVFNVYAANQDPNTGKYTYSARPITTKQLKLDIRTDGNDEPLNCMHNDVVRYFRQYVDGNPADETTRLSDKLIALKFTTNEATLRGVNVKYGTYAPNIDVSPILQTMLMRERPLMETDGMICSLFSDNHIIAPQLFNFNFVFDPDDLLPLNFMNSLNNKTLSFSVDVMVGDVKLPVCDFYTNYEYIKAFKLTNVDNTYPNGLYSDYNVFDYLNDTKCIDLLPRNKMVQSVCHWALQNNPNYTFNVYNGFSPWFEDARDNTKLIQTSGQFYGTPNLYAQKFSVADANVKWLNNYQWSQYWEASYDAMPNTYYNIILKNNAMQTWINGIQYDTDNIDNPNANDWDGKQIFAVLWYCNNMYDLPVDCHEILNVGGTIIKYRVKNITSNIDVIHIYYNVKDSVTFYNFKNTLQQYVANTQLTDDTIAYLHLLNNYMQNAIYPTKLVIADSVRAQKAQSPDYLISKAGAQKTQSTEIYYAKTTNAQVVLYRYDGWILPQFITIGKRGAIANSTTNVSNYIYSVPVWNDYKQIKRFNDISFTKFSPLYPSLGYFAYDILPSNDNINNEDITSKTVKYDEPTIIRWGVQTEWNSATEFYRGERCWYDRGIVRILKNTIKFIITNTEDVTPTEEWLATEIFKTLCAQCGFDYEDLSARKVFETYVYPLYKITWTWEYAQTNNILLYKYNVNCTLK